MERPLTTLLERPVEPFDLDSYLCTQDERLMAVSEGRVVACMYDPLLFALTYLSDHLKSDETGGQVTFAEFHLDIVAQAKQWVRSLTEPAEARDCYVAPRKCGKSTWFFLILPMWSAAYGWVKFAAAFADTSSQAETHLQTFKIELETNVLLRLDFPDLCTPATRGKGQTVSDSRGMLVTKSGFAFAARGIDSAALGLKIGHQRPDLLILDDIEPKESDYSPYLKEKRLGTLLNAILQLNIYARVVIVGTVTMPDSIIHNIVQRALGMGDVPKWVDEEKIRAHYYPAILTDPVTGSERSIWPEQWSLDYLQGIRHTRVYALNYENNPLGREGDFWRVEDIEHDTLPALTHQLLSIDPAVTAKDQSDFTAMALIGHYAPEKRCVVRDTWNLRIPPGEALRARVLAILEQYPDCRGILVERNQGGEAWEAIFHDMPVKVRLVHNSVKKEVRAAGLLNHYQARRVIHEKKMHEAEGQLISFPKGAYDDLVDCIGNGVEVFLGKKKKTGMTQTSYV